MVDLYLLHAGVSKAQLPHIVEGFMQQHDLFGAAPTESTVLLNRWEDDALEFLHPSIITPRRAILWDETAWHASLYARVARAPESFEASTPLEAAFLECYLKAQTSQTRSSGHVSAPPRPRLHWGSDGIALRLPRAEGRIAVWFDDAERPLRLKGGEDWLLEQPWPTNLRVEINGQGFQLSFLSDSNRFAVFDVTVGHLLTERPAGGPSAIELDTTDAVIVARQPFEVDGVLAHSMGEECFVLRTSLGHRQRHFLIGKHRLGLRTKPRRRLILSGDEVASGSSGKLFGPGSTIFVETGLETAETRRVRATSSGNSWLIDVNVAAGSGVASLGDWLPEGLPSDPLHLRLELMAPSIASEDPRPSGISLEAWIWPGFRSAEGLTLLSNPSPRNFLAEQSAFVTSSPQGLQLDATGGYSHATAAFDIGGEVVAFRLPWPDISIQRHRSDGSVSPVQTGSRISIGADDRFGYLSIRCPDREASLRVGGRNEAKPFALGMTRSIAISDLMGQGRDSAVVLTRSNGAEVVLFEIVDVLDPSCFELRPSRSGLEVVLALSTSINAIGIEEESELGLRTFNEVSLGRWPSRSPPPDWVAANIASEDAHKTRISIRLTDGVDGLRIGRIYVRPDTNRPDESWRPLRNARGDTFAVPLTTPHSLEEAASDHIKTRFETLSRWMADCYALECWLNHGLERVLGTRWRNLGRAIADLPLGSGFLIEASLAPPPDETSRSWVPLAHPVEIDPGLYSAVPAAFLSLGELSEDGLRVGARLASLSQERLREGLLHSQALMAFANSKKAQSSGEALTGFDPVQFFKLFAFFDTNPSAGWFWHGAPLLGPGHLRASFQRYLDRLEAAKVFVSVEQERGYNSRRSEALSTLVSTVWTQTNPENRPQMPKRSVEDDRATQVDLWVATTLSEFARASRGGAARSFVEDLAKALNWREEDLLASLGFLLRLAPELFFYFLLVWQLAKVRP